MFKNTVIKRFSVLFSLSVSIQALSMPEDELMAALAVFHWPKESFSQPIESVQVRFVPVDGVFYTRLQALFDPKRWHPKTLVVPHPEFGQLIIVNKDYKDPDTIQKNGLLP